MGVLVSGSKIRTLRLDLALSQEELAERAGLARSTVLKLEASDAQEARPSTVRKLARALGVAARELRASQ